MKKELLKFVAKKSLSAAKSSTENTSRWHMYEPPLPKKLMKGILNYKKIKLNVILRINVEL